MPALDKLAEQYSGQIHKVVDQMRRLPSYQVNWPVVRDVMHDMEENFRELRRVAQKMLAMANADDQRRDLQKLMTLCDRKIDQCVVVIAIGRHGQLHRASDAKHTYFKVENHLLGVLSSG